MIKGNKKTIILNGLLAVIALALIATFTVIEFRKTGIISTSESKQILKDFNKYYNSEEEKIIYYASSTCGYCELQTPILETIAKDYNLDYLYIDSTKLSISDRKEIIKKLDIEGATPTTVIASDGEVVDVLDGYTPGNEFVEFLKDNDILEEDATYSAEKYITYIDYSEYEKLISEASTNVVVIGQTTCSHCIAIKPALNSIAKDYNLTINYLNLTDMSESEKSSFFESLKTIEYNDEDFLNDGSFGTPLTLIIENGKVKNYISGERTISQLRKDFQKNGLID